MKIKALFTTVIIFTLLLACSCKASSQTKASRKKGEKAELALPLSGPEYAGTSDYFRARQSGTSPDLPLAKKIAVQNAKAKIAGEIQAVISRTTDHYASELTIGHRQEFISKFEEFTRDVAQGQVVGATMLAEKVVRDKEGLYTCWVVVEVPKQSILDGMDKAVVSHPEVTVGFEKERFKKAFEEEMEKPENDKR